MECVGHQPLHPPTRGSPVKTAKLKRSVIKGSLLRQPYPETFLLLLAELGSLFWHFWFSAFASSFFFNPFLWLRNFNSLKISKLFLLYWRRFSVFERFYGIITSNLLTFYIASLVWPSTLSNFHAQKIQHKNKNIPNLSLDVISFMFWKFQIPLKHDISRFFRD